MAIKVTRVINQRSVRFFLHFGFPFFVLAPAAPSISGPQWYTLDHELLLKSTLALLPLTFIHFMTWQQPQLSNHGISPAYVSKGLMLTPLPREAMSTTVVTKGIWCVYMS